jgi:multidrug efflux pump subunit AcrA (membrane-fusion protein)
MTDRRIVVALLLLLTACGGEAKEAEREHAETAEAGHASDDLVTLTPSAVQNAGIELATAGRAAGAVSAAIDAPGQVEADPSRIAFVSSRAAGRLERLVAVIGDRVEAGQVVAWVQSPAFVTAQHDYQLAVRREAVIGMTADSSGARALRQAAEDRLKLLGVSEREIDALRRGDAPAPLLAVTAPFPGSLVEGLTLAGAAVEPGTPIFRLIDLRELDIAADVAEQQLPLLRIGQDAIVIVPAYPDLRITGRVERIKDELDPTTRTIEALIHVRNPNGVLRPGMFARVRVGSGTAAAATSGAVTVPASALLSDGGQQYLFVAKDSVTFERREVRLASADARYGAIGGLSVVIDEGLQAGERVVAKGAFILKSELAKAGLGDDH